MMGTQVGGWVSACLEEGDAAEPFDAFPRSSRERHRQMQLLGIRELKFPVFLDLRIWPLYIFWAIFLLMKLLRKGIIILHKRGSCFHRMRKNGHPREIQYI